jgi:hypothetical protein
MSTVNPMPPLGQIKGAIFHRDATEHSSRVQIQCMDTRGILYDLWLPFLDAMYLRNTLSAIESQAGFGDFSRVGEK